MLPLRRAFTALELLVAMAIGLVVAGTMFALFRAVAATANRVARMSQENQALRSGLLAVCEQNVDRWLDADDPLGDPGDPRQDYLSNTIRNAWNADVWNQGDPSRPIDGARGQGLRGFDTTRASVAENWCTGAKQGLPFTPLEWLRDQYEFSDPALLLGEPSPAALAGSEDETGWDRDYHWAAADERTWFHGDAGVHVPQGPASSPNAGSVQTERRLQFGRYAIISNPWRTANLVAGYTDSAFGVVQPRRAWRERQLLNLVNALGYFGTLAYTPANTIFATHGAEFLQADGTTLGKQNRSVGPLPPTAVDAPTPCWNFIATVSGGSGTTYYGFPGLNGSANELFWGGQILSIGLYPASVYARDVLYPDGNCYTYLGDRIKNQAQARTINLVAVHRDNDARWNHSGPIYHGPRGNYEGKDYEMVTMATAKRPLLVQRPEDWPEVLIGTTRVVWGARQIATCTVRWSDPVTGRFQSLSFNVLGTSLRGARQQRRLPGLDPATGRPDYADPGGWARWLEPWALRQARKAAIAANAIPDDPWTRVPNDRCLDDYHDPVGTPAPDPEFQP